MVRETVLLEQIGSDHLPLLVDLCHSRGPPPPGRQGLSPTPSEKERTADVVREGREEAGE